MHAPDEITMHDHPTRAIPQKPNSSISVGFDLLASDEIQAFASTGNTGACTISKSSGFPPCSERQVKI